MENLDLWSVRIAQAVAPHEVDFAPFITQAVIDGDELPSSSGGLGGFGPADVNLVFPIVVNTILATGTLLGTVLSTPAAANFFAAVNTLIKVNETIERDKKVKELPDHPYGALKKVMEDFSTGLKATGLPQTDRDLMTYKFMQTLLADPVGAHDFVQRLQISANDSRSKKKSKR